MYHSWTFRNTGVVHTIRGEDGFTGGLQREDFNLQEVPRIESYREFVFICFAPDAPNLVTYLGNVALYIDFLADQGNDGMEIVEGTHARTRRFVSNVRLIEVDDDYVRLAANFMIVRMKKRTQDMFIGHYDHLLKIVDGKIRFQRRRSILDLKALRLQRSISIII